MSATLLFPLGAVLISILALVQPDILSPFKGAIVPLLGIVMLGMGMTLRPENFLEILKRPRMIAIGVSLQFLLMPAIAMIVSHLFGLSEAMMVGMVLLGSCPGGTASNVICYLARGDLALSISLTTVSTLMAVIMTPVLTWIYVGQSVEVPVVNMIINIFKIILLPVSVGIALNHYFSRQLGIVKKVFPFVSALAIVFIIGIIVSLNRSQFFLLALPVLAAIFWHNFLGLLSGYYVSKILGLDERQCRTIAIEVGMQNSGLAVALAHSYFSAAAALPGALFSIWHNITGSIMAGIWSARDLKKSKSLHG
ncbi:MAG: bile acid:sodium symporter [Gammaproteobacteria bacterium]|nr:bile acid:sodium symporter [Gammaproteobacteria bacterium]